MGFCCGQFWRCWQGRCRHPVRKAYRVALSKMAIAGKSTLLLIISVPSLLRKLLKLPVVNSKALYFEWNEFDADLE